MRAGSCPVAAARAFQELAPFNPRATGVLQLVSDVAEERDSLTAINQAVVVGQGGEPGTGQDTLCTLCTSWVNNVNSICQAGMMGRASTLPSTTVTRPLTALVPDTMMDVCFCSGEVLSVGLLQAPRPWTRSAGSFCRHTCGCKSQRTSRFTAVPARGAGAHDASAKHSPGYAGIHDAEGRLAQVLNTQLVPCSSICQPAEGCRFATSHSMH